MKQPYGSTRRNRTVCLIDYVNYITDSAKPIDTVELMIIFVDKNIIRGGYIMKKKLRQVTDTIHNSIYLSELESEMMSTAYFYRLHDVYQSSTVYLAFPCNRTKRYEHSCGTMDVAGRMWFYAIANASTVVRNKLFDDAEKEYKKIIKGILKANPVPSYCRNFKEQLSNCFPITGRREIDKNVSKVLELSYNNCNSISDIALEHYMPPFYTDINKRKFLYQCILESIRIVALFHDIGHPPFSHIMETVLSDLYKRCEDDFNKDTHIFNDERAETLIESLSPFYTSDSDDIVCILSKTVDVKPALHEQVGLKMLNLALSDTLKNQISEICSEKTFDDKSVLAAYYVTIAEFSIAILREANPFFASLHRIIDGIVDADRMDYVERDTRNSGVDWGKVSYKRLLESCKLTINKKYKGFYFVAFPRKMTEDIDDLLVTRYKIFSRINFNHRAFKTSIILQRLVYLLSVDYLKKDDSQKSLCPNICDLWCCLYNTLSSYDLYIIQWNDSTLVSHLYSTLIDCKPNRHDDYNMKSEEYAEIINMLEEFLLNKKHYYSVFKRQSDFIPILENVFTVLIPDIERVRKYESQKLIDNNADSNAQYKDNARDSMLRLDKRLLDSFIKSGDISGLAEILPLKVSIKEIIERVLQKFKLEKEINTYLIEFNAKRTNTGLPKTYNESNGIYLYTSYNEDSKIYDISILKKQIVQLQNHCLQYIVYIETEYPPNKVIENINQEFQRILVQEFRNAMQEIFTCLQENA